MKVVVHVTNELSMRTEPILGLVGFLMWAEAVQSDKM